jgi:hypothetical protein
MRAVFFFTPDDGDFRPEHIVKDLKFLSDS